MSDAGASAISDVILAALAEVNMAVNENWRVDRLLPGGWQEGAWLLRNGAGEHAVLKLHLVEQERVVAAESRIELARSRGWPTPAWLAIGRMPNGGVWVLQEYVAGRRPDRLGGHEDRLRVGDAGDGGVNERAARRRPPPWAASSLLARFDSLGEASRIVQTTELHL